MVAPAIGALLATGAVQPALLGISAEKNRIPVPKISPGDLLKAALDIQALNARGLDPRLTTDPFTGDFVVSSADQSQFLEQILLDRAVGRESVATPRDVQEIRELRDVIIEARSGPAFFTPSTPTGRVTAPGVVSRGNRLRSRVSGPCAGVLTQAQRAVCSRGGFA